MRLTDSILCWALIGLPALGSLIVLVRAIRVHLLPRHPRCGRCSYDLTGNRSKRCPECGQDLRSPAALLRNRPLAERLLVCAILLGVSLYALPIRNRVMNIRESWDTALLPTTARLAMFPWISHDSQAIVAGRLFDNPKFVEGWAWQCEWLIRRYGDAVRSDDESRATGAILCLRALAPRHRSAVITVCEALKSGDAARRRTVASALGAMYSDIPGIEERNLIVDALIAALSRETETWNLLIAMNAIEQMGLSAVQRSADMLLELSHHSEPAVRAMTWHAMSMLDVEHLARLSDADLGRALDDLGADCSYAHDGVTHFFGGRGWPDRLPDFYLSQIIGRGGAALEARVRDRIKKRSPVRGMEQYYPQGALCLYRMPEYGQLELLTALRRIERRPDPLTVEVEVGGPEQDILTVRLVNTDPDRLTYLIQRGGDNRGPRMERFNVEVRDARNEILDTRFETNNFGGLSGAMPLPPGKSITDSFKLADYARMPTAPGEYTIVVHYHNVLQIANLTDLHELVTSRSKPIVVSVR